MYTATARKLNHWFKEEYGALTVRVLDPSHKKAINLGCGNRPLQGFLNVDLVDAPGVDALVDLEKPLPYETGSVDLIFADNVFEHIRRYIELLTECSRVLRAGGKLVVDVPYFRSAGAFIDPTHVNFFTLRSLRYFIPGTYESEKYGYLPTLFRTLRVVVNPTKQSAPMAIISLVAGSRPEWIEDTPLSVVLPIRSVRFVLEK